MSIHFNLIELPNISDFKCIEGILNNVIELNKDCSLDTKIRQIGLVVLAEVATIFDLTIEMIIFSKECCKDFLNFSFYQTKKLKQLSINTIKLGYFFIGLIPFIIQSQMDFKKLSRCLPDKKITTQLPQVVQPISIKINYEQEIKKYIENFNFYFYENQITDIKCIEEVLFWTTEQNYKYLINQKFLNKDLLTDDDKEKLESLNKLYKNGYELYELHQKLYTLSLLHFINTELNGDIKHISKTMNLDSKKMSLHEKIFQSFKRLFFLYEKQIYLVTKEQKTSTDLELIFFFTNILPHLTGLLEIYLKINYPEIITTEIKPIKDIHLHLDLDPSTNKQLKIKNFLSFLNNISTDDSPYLKIAISCLEKSLRKSLESCIINETLL